MVSINKYLKGFMGDFSTKAGSAEYQRLDASESVDNVTINSGHGEVNTRGSEDKVEVKLGAFFSVSGNFQNTMNVTPKAEDSFNFQTDPRHHVVETFQVFASMGNTSAAKYIYYAAVRDIETNEFVSCVRSEGPIKIDNKNKTEVIPLHPPGVTGAQDGAILDLLIARGKAKEAVSNNKDSLPVKPTDRNIMAEDPAPPVSGKGLGK